MANNLGARDLDGFFGEIVTSSPIEKSNRFFGNEGGFSPDQRENSATWSALLRNYQREENRKPPESPPSISSDTFASSSLEPIAESHVRVLLTPNHKVRILSNSTRKLPRQATPGRPSSSYSRLSKAYRERFDEPPQNVEKENIQAIKARLKSGRESLTLDEINRYERIVLDYVDHQRQQEVPEPSLQSPKAGASMPDSMVDSELMRFVENQLGRLDLTPGSVRQLRMQEQEQEKRLIRLSIAKRRSAVEIKKKIENQQVTAKQQIKIREEQEMKQIRASKLRQKAVTNAKLFSQTRSAHHQHVVKEARLKANVTQLQQQMRSEKAKNNLQANTIVRDVWATFLRQQYDELRQQMQEQGKEQKDIVRKSEVQLQRFKSSYEEKLRELKSIAAAKASEAGLERKEVSLEIDRIRRGMQRQFQTEFQSLLQKIETKGNHQRLIRGEKVAGLKHRLQKADYVFDL